MIITPQNRYCRKLKECVVYQNLPNKDNIRKKEYYFQTSCHTTKLNLITIKKKEDKNEQNQCVY